MTVIDTVISIFLLLFIGYGTKKIRLLKAEDADLLNNVVVYLTLPAFIFEAIYTYHQPLPLSIAKVPIIGFLMIAAVIVVAYFVGKALRLNKPTLAGLMLAAAFGNTGFLGYPVIKTAFTAKGALVTAVLYDEIAMALPLYTLGAAIASGFAGERFDRKQFVKVLTLPSMLAIPIALILRPVALPHPLMTSIRYLSEGTVPLVMISLGLSLSATALKGYAVPVLAACVLKLGLLPVLTYYSMRAGGVDGVMLQAGVVESGMPSAVMTCVIAAKFGANAKFVAAAIFVSTLLSIAAIPTVLVLLRV